MLDTQALHSRMRFGCNNKIGVVDWQFQRNFLHITRQNELGGQWNTVQRVGCPGDWSAAEVEPGSSLILTPGGNGLHGNGTQMFKGPFCCLGYHLPLSPL